VGEGLPVLVVRDHELRCTRPRIRNNSLDYQQSNSTVAAKNLLGDEEHQKRRN
jgi:hypothetical protein